MSVYYFNPSTKELKSSEIYLPQVGDVVISFATFCEGVEAREDGADFQRFCNSQYRDLLNQIPIHER